MIEETLLLIRCDRTKKNASYDKLKYLSHLSLIKIHTCEMKTIYLLSIVLMFIVLLFIGCEKKNNENPNESINGKLINYSDCKSFKSTVLKSDNEKNESCIEYFYDSQNKRLQLNHINAGFNCCPDILYCNIIVPNDSIIISEFEKNALCHCNCLYDLEIEINGIESKKYFIRIIEPYCGNQTKLNFEIDLISCNEGMYCVNRNNYPWGL